MSLDINNLLDQAKGSNYQLHEQHINPKFVKALRTIGFDHCYVKANGPYLWDEQGHRYLDMLSGYGVFNFGRNNPQIRQSLIDFMEAEYASLVQMEAPLLSGLLAAELKKYVGRELDYVFFTNSGTEGIETAIKFTRCASQRDTILYTENSFHGLTLGALSINNTAMFRDKFEPLLPNCIHIPFNDLEALEQALSKHQIAAFIVEPIQGKGVNIPATNYLREASHLCQRFGTFLVIDEVQTGFCRTGEFLCIDHDKEIAPDVVVLSKSLSGGFVPVGAVLTKKSIHEKVFSSMERSVVHSSTFGQGSLAMVAGLASLNYLTEHQMTQSAQRLGDKLGNGLKRLQERFDFIGEVRWKGLMLGIEFSKPRRLTLRYAWDLAHRLDKNLFPQAITMPLLQDHRILTQTSGYHTDIIKLIPPLVISDEDILYFLDAFEQVMVGLHQFPGPVWEVVSRVGKVALQKNTR